ncbi:MAG: choice-of-anchor tandem repeat GloVer-containing protein, partial [Candidatus Tumulicola sp.]
MAGPGGQLAIDPEGNIYGTSERQYGSVFQVTPEDTLNVLYHFPRDVHRRKSRQQPRGGVSLDALGNVFGTVSHSGSMSRGAIFKITTTDVESTVYSFTGGPSGRLPESPLVLDGAGNIYGTAAGQSDNDGIAYMVTPSETETILHSFGGCCNDGLTSGVLRLSSNGKLLGTTPLGGEYGGGTLYVISQRGFAVVHNFGGKTYQGVADGKFPSGGVIDLQGKIYGVTAAGGTYGKGALYEFVRRSG